MFAFALAVLFLLITPGPGVLSAAGVGAGFGYGPGLRYLSGLFIGSNLVGLAVVSGLAALAFSVPWLRAVLLVASVGYLIYLALRIALAGARTAFVAARKAPGLINGVLVQLINPKAYAVNTTLFSGFGFWPDSLTVEIAFKFLIVNLIWLPIHVLWLAAGVTLRRMELAPRQQFAINLLMALSLLLVVALAGWSQWTGLGGRP